LLKDFVKRRGEVKTKKMKTSFVKRRGEREVNLVKTSLSKTFLVGLIAAFLFFTPLALAIQHDINASLPVQPKPKVKPIKYVRVLYHARGAAITSDASEFHAMAAHGRLVKVIPFETLQQIKSSAANCTGGDCLEQYGVEKAVGLIRFGEILASTGGEKYWFVGSYDDSTKTVTGSLYSGKYTLACIREDPSCTAVVVGTASATIYENYEGIPHFVVGKINFTGGKYAGKSFNFMLHGWKNVKGMPLPRVETTSVETA